VLNRDDETAAGKLRIHSNGISLLMAGPPFALRRLHSTTKDTPRQSAAKALRFASALARGYTRVRAETRTAWRDAVRPEVLFVDGRVLFLTEENQR
jgi:hypothetical protein